MMENQIIRVSIQSLYYKTALEQYNIYRALDIKLEELENFPNEQNQINTTEMKKIETCYENREQAAVISIVFSGMCLEAFFYDYAAKVLSDSFVKNHLDKLDLKSKFIVYPKLICGKAPDKSGKAYNSLGKLVALRNDLIHFKSKGFDTDKLINASDFHSELNNRLKTGVKNAVKCIGLVLDELDSLHEDNEISFHRSIQWPGYT